MSTGDAMPATNPVANTGIPKTPLAKVRGRGGNAMPTRSIGVVSSKAAVAVTPPGAAAPRASRLPNLKRKRDELAVDPNFDIYEEIKKFTAALTPLCVPYLCARLLRLRKRDCVRVFRR